MKGFFFSVPVAELTSAFPSATRTFSPSLSPERISIRDSSDMPIFTSRNSGGAFSPLPTRT